MTDMIEQPYKMSFSTGGLFFNESVEVARLHVRGEGWEVTIRRAMEEGATALPKSASNRRTLREISNRLLTLTDEELVYLVEKAERTDRQALLWLATCRAYRFVREYAIEVVCERHLSRRLDLPLETFDHLLEEKVEWDEGLAAIAPTTARKLRQVLFRMMREAGVIDHSHRIQTSNMSRALRALLERTAPSDLAVFPGVAGERF